jgi:lipopolysaccharide export system permease protein
MTGPLVTRIDRYLFRQLFAALIAVTGALVALIWLTQSLRFVELVVNRGLSLLVFLRLTSLLIPNFVAVILPITTFVVVQFVYQRLAGDRELTVMRAAGLSPFALARPALAVGVLSMAACLALNIYLVPWSYTAFREFEFEIRNRMAAFMLQEGVFTPVSDNLTVYVRSRDREGTLHGILIEDARDPNSRATILAESGRLAVGAAGPRVVLENGSREVIDRQTGRLGVATFRSYTMDLSNNDKSDDQRYRDSTELSIHELLHPDLRMVSPRDIGKFEVEAYRRMTTPLTVLSFDLIALAAVLGGAFRRHGGLLRPVVAIGLVVGLLALELTIQNIASRLPVLIPLMWVHAILPGLIAAGTLFGPRLRSYPRPASLRLRAPSEAT